MTPERAQVSNHVSKVVAPGSLLPRRAIVGTRPHTFARRVDALDGDAARGHRLEDLED